MLTRLNGVKKLFEMSENTTRETTTKTQIKLSTTKRKTRFALLLSINSTLAQKPLFMKLAVII